MPAKTSKKKTSPRRTRSTASGWNRASRGEDVSLPSGEVALVRRPGPAALLSGGLLPDSLTPIVMEAVNKGKGLPQSKVADLAKDPKALADIMDGMDRMLVLVVVEPKVAYHKREIVDAEGNPKNGTDGKPATEVIPDDEREPETYVYTDEIDLQDKMFLFNYAVGGTRQFEPFRQELRSRVGDLSTREAGTEVTE